MNDLFEKLVSSHFFSKLFIFGGLFLIIKSIFSILIFRISLQSLFSLVDLVAGVGFLISGMLFEHILRQTALLEHIVLLLSQPLKVEPVKRTESQVKPEVKNEVKDEVVNSKPAKPVVAEPISEPVQPVSKRVVKPVSPEEQARVKEQVRQRMLEQQRLELLERQRLDKLAQNKSSLSD